MTIQWYPGHMTKAKRMMQENIKLVDSVIELLDARLPVSSRNPDIKGIAGQKPRLIILTKVDLADPTVTAAWQAYFEEQHIKTLTVDAKKGKNIKAILPAIEQICQAKLERYRQKGLKNKALRAMVVGIPNVGKSTVINQLVGKKSAKTGNQPGVTRGKQWIKLKNNIELLDTPGILWPKFDDPMVGKKLAFVGSIKQEVLDSYHLAVDCLSFMRQYYPEVTRQLFKGVNMEAERPSYQIFEELTRQSNMLRTGGEADVERFAPMFLEKFRNGKYGRFSLDFVGENE